MPRLYVTTYSGETHTLDAQPGRTMMETIRDAGISDLLALCGGCRSCATCHVYVDEDFLARLPPQAPEEGELLDFSSQRRANSRLSCQLPITDALNGVRVTIAPED
jgi:2Fe-2S ferredoxin